MSVGLCIDYMHSDTNEWVIHSDMKGDRDFWTQLLLTTPIMYVPLNIERIVCFLLQKTGTVTRGKAKTVSRKDDATFWILW